MNNSFEGREFMRYSRLNFNLFLHISVEIFSGFSKSSSAFQKSFVQIREMCQPRRRGELHSAVFERVWKFKSLNKKGLRTIF
jgi:hypothetical protein